MNFRTTSIALFVCLWLVQGRIGGQGRGAAPAPDGRPGALIDLTGYWVSIVDEDWRWRMVTPPKGDFASVPLNAEGRRVGNLWDPAKDESEGNQCKAYGAAGLMRLPIRLHISWADDMTLQVESDAGAQRRMFQFGGSRWQGGEPQWQGDSVASWVRQYQSRGFAPPFGGPVPGKGGALKLVTTHMRPGYLRKNGVPYSENAILTEYFDRIEFDGGSYLILTSIVEDPLFLSDLFVTSEQFRHEPDASKWNPQPCKVK
ncbi:MAG: hypothetical protein C5B51_04935 [Terriglobia bacterium]|nr:MAG: hypothetical protein C5B51_04935 [Terriglobia bacterium]